MLNNFNQYQSKSPNLMVFDPGSYLISWLSWFFSLLRRPWWKEFLLDKFGGHRSSDLLMEAAYFGVFSEFSDSINYGFLWVCWFHEFDEWWGRFWRSWCSKALMNLCVFQLSQDRVTRNSEVFCFAGEEAPLLSLIQNMEIMKMKIDDMSCVIFSYDMFLLLKMHWSWLWGVKNGTE